MKKKVCIVVLNWNGLELLKNLLGCLEKQKEDYAVIVVDNGSDDGSSEFLSAYREMPLNVLLLKKNEGFALGNNLGISLGRRLFDPRYFLLLNNDTVFDSDLVLKMADKAKEYSEQKNSFPFISRKGWKTGSITPLIENYYRKMVDSAGILVYPDGSAINRGVGEKISFKGDEEVFGPTGAAVLYSAEALEDVALPARFTADLKKLKGRDIWRACLRKGAFPVKEYFSSRHFTYYEDVDLAWRLRLKKWGTVFTPEVKVVHRHSATGISYSPFKSYHIHRNQYFNLIRNFPSYYLLTGFMKAFKRYFYLLLSIGRKKGPAHALVENSCKMKVLQLVVKGWFSLLVNLPGLLREREIIQGRRDIDLKVFKQIINHPSFAASLDKMIFYAPYVKQGQRKSGAKGKPPAS